MRSASRMVAMKTATISKIEIRKEYGIRRYSITHNIHSSDRCYASASLLDAGAAALSTGLALKAGNAATCACCWEADW